MTSQVLNCFGIYRRMNEVGNVGMPQLMWRNFKIQAVNHLAIMGRLFSKNRRDRMFYTLSIFVPVINPFLCRSGNNILPEPLKLRVRQRFTIPICNHILRSRGCFCRFQALRQTIRQRDISRRCFCFQFIQDDRPVMLCVPCSPYRQIWSIRRSR